MTAKSSSMKIELLDLVKLNSELNGVIQNLLTIFSRYLALRAVSKYSLLATTSLISALI